MKRFGILTAGGDTPALNATIHGAVTRANQLKVGVGAGIQNPQSESKLKAEIRTGRRAAPPLNFHP